MIMFSYISNVRSGNKPPSSCMPEELYTMADQYRYVVYVQYTFSYSVSWQVGGRAVQKSSSEAFTVQYYQGFSLSTGGLTLI